VPAEVLAALPTAEEILAKADAARRRALAAREAVGGIHEDRPGASNGPDVH
jgi:hypothetical protein